MEQGNCSTNQKKYKHLSESERYKIEALLEGKNKVDGITWRPNQKPLQLKITDLPTEAMATIFPIWMQKIFAIQFMN